jgi:hypothetical protein
MAPRGTPAIVAMTSARPVTSMVSETIARRAGSASARRMPSIANLLVSAAYLTRTSVTQCEYREANSSAPTTSWISPSRPVIGLPSRS